MKLTLILLIASVALAACAGTASSNPALRPGEDLIPTPTSLLIDSFVWQTDGLFGYRMLRPANWESANSIDSRVHSTPGFRTQADRIVLRVVNLQAYYKSGTTPNGLNATLFLFEQAPSLEGWTAGVEQNWKSIGIEATLLRTLPQAKIYAVKSPGASDILLVAYAVHENQPLAMELAGSGAYADLERLQSEGILEDWATMVASAQAIPQDPQNVNPPLTEHESSTLVPSPTLDPSSLPTGWTWYQSQAAGYRIAHPQSWTARKHWGSNARPGAIQERVSFQPRDASVEVIVDVWNAPSRPGLDLLAWINANPEGVLLTKWVQPVSYNATILGLPAVFHYQPAGWGTGDVAIVIFADGKHRFRILFNSSAIPPREPDARVYRTMLESFTLPEIASGNLSVPTGWERGAGLVVSLRPHPLSTDVSADEQRRYRQGLTGIVEGWIEDLVNEGAFTLIGEDGQKHIVRIEPFGIHFRGSPLDHVYRVSEAPAAGSRVQVAGYPLASGDLLAEYIAVEQDGGWRTWFSKTLFDITAGEFDPVLLAHYQNDKDCPGVASGAAPGSIGISGG